MAQVLRWAEGSCTHELLCEFPPPILPFQETKFQKLKEGFCEQFGLESVTFTVGIEPRVIPLSYCCADLGIKHDDVIVAFCTPLPDSEVDMKKATMRHEMKPDVMTRQEADKRLKVILATAKPGKVLRYCV
jgi:hypothetical protein